VIGLRISAALIATFILAPTIVVVGSSFSGGNLPQFPPSDLSLRWYAHALAQPIFTEAAFNSLWLALVATAIATPIALAAAIAIVRGDFAGKTAVQAVLLAPLFVPAIVVSLSILLVSARLNIREVGLRLVAAHVLITMPYLVRTLIASLTRFDVTLEEAARTLGASPLRTFRIITLPLISPGLVAGALFALVVSFDNVSVSLFLTSARTNTLPLSILNYVEYNYDPSIAALSTMLVCISLLAAVVLERLVGLRRVIGS
jgi:putative spermidine/putrescine transport system permease protein